MKQDRTGDSFETIYFERLYYGRCQNGKANDGNQWF